MSDGDNREEGEQSLEDGDWPAVTLVSGRGITAGGTAYRVEGSGPPVVLLHGIGLDNLIWRDLLAKLRANHTVIIYDLLGHGESPAPAAHAGLNAYVAQLIELLNALGVQQLALVGHSLGALVAQSFALQYPGRVSKLILLNSVYDRSDEARSAVLGRVAAVELQGAGALIDHVLTRWISPEYRSGNPGMIARLKMQLSSNASEGFVEAYRTFADADADLSGRLGAIRAKTLVMTGELDGGSTPAMSRALAGAIPGAQLGIAPGMRHLMLLEASKPVCQTIFTFLRK